MEDRRSRGDTRADSQDRLSRIASAAASTTWTALPGEVHQRVLDLVTDTFAVTAWGSRREELVALRGVCADEPEGSSTVLGTAQTTSVQLAASLNGSAAAPDQLQDGHRLARGHPASHVVLAAFALAEARHSSTEAMLSAILAGYEVGTRIGLAMGGTPSGIHDIGTWGVVATAVTTANLLSPNDPDAITRAVELSASSVLLGDAHTIFSGHRGGHAFLGASVSHGLWMGRAAAAGLSAAPGALDRFFAAHAARSWAGLPPEDPEGWREYEVLRGYIKLHPACAHLHGALDAVDDILHSQPEGLRAADVRSVRVRTYRAASAFSRPADHELEARFSIPTSVAIMLRHGHLDDAVLTDDEVRNEHVRAPADRVEVEHDPELDDGYPGGRPTTVEILLKDGRSLRAASARPRGDADGDSSRQAFRAKTARLLDGAFGAHAAELQDVLAHWPTDHTPREVGTRFRLAAAANQKAHR